MRSARAGALVSLVLAIVPSIANAQDASGPRLVLDVTTPSTTLWTGLPGSSGFWNLPTTANGLPQLTIDWKTVIKGPGGPVFSAEFVGRPGTYREQAGMTLGIRSPAL